MEVMALFQLHFFFLQKACFPGFHLISFEKISILDSYFIHRFIIMKYRSSMI